MLRASFFVKSVRARISPLQRLGFSAVSSRAVLNALKYSSLQPKLLRHFSSSSSPQPSQSNQPPNSSEAKEAEAEFKMEPMTEAYIPTVGKSAWYWTVGDVLVGLMLGASFYNLFDFIFSFPEPAPTAISIAEKHPRVIEVLGAPLSRSYNWKGTVTPEYADLLLPVSGPKAEGWVHGKAVFADGQWHWMMFFAELPNRETVSLMTYSQPPSNAQQSTKLLTENPHRPKAVKTV